MNSAVFYARCSTDKQEHSIQTQLDQFRDYMAGHNITTYPELIFEDEGVSGFSKPIYERRSGRAAIDALRQGVRLADGSLEHPKHIVFSAVDRVGRRLVDILNFSEWCEKHGFTIHIVGLGGIMNINNADPANEMQYRIILMVTGLLAEMEVRMTRSRIRSTFRSKRQRGELCSAPAFGQRAVPTNRTTERRVLQPDGSYADVTVPVMGWDIEPAELATLQRMVDWEQDGWGCWKIASHLNASGITSKHGGRWTSHKVQKVLGNRFTAMVKDGTLEEQLARFANL